MKAKFLTALKEVLAVPVTMILIIAISIIVSTLLWNPLMRPNPSFTVSLVQPVYTLAISIIFSIKHITNLVKKTSLQQIEISYTKLCIVILLAVSLYVNNTIWIRLGIFLTNLLPFEFDRGIFLTQTIQVAHFMLWFNLIHSVRLKPKKKRTLILKRKSPL